MLNEKQINEIREHLEKAQNPVFFYDNDADGFSSFILLRKFIGRGKGVVVKSYPDLDLRYLRRIQEFNSDYVFILDKPEVSKEFLAEIDKIQIPVVWIDHHEIKNKDEYNEFSNVHIYNPTLNLEKSSEPVTYLAYKITGKKENAWLALAGCVADHYMPEFADEVKEEYPDLWKKGIEKPFDVYYKTEIGRIAQSINFGLKDSITNVTAMQNFFINCNSTRDVFSESNKNKAFLSKIDEINKKYRRLIERSEQEKSKKIIFFEYSGELSINSEIANEIHYFNPEKYIIVAYKKGTITNFSIRGDNVLKILNKILINFKDSSGGGHRDAVGGRIKTEDLERFKEEFCKELV